MGWKGKCRVLFVRGVSVAALGDCGSLHAAEEPHRDAMAG